jgi:hypothetical protein
MNILSLLAPKKMVATVFDKKPSLLSMLTHKLKMRASSGF